MIFFIHDIKKTAIVPLYDLKLMKKRSEEYTDVLRVFSKEGHGNI